MIRLEGIKEAYNTLSVEKKEEVVTEISEYFEISKETVKTNWLSALRFPKKMFKTKAREKVREILNSKMN